jgi:hypothetical protein
MFHLGIFTQRYHSMIGVEHQARSGLSTSPSLAQRKTALSDGRAETA